MAPSCREESRGRGGVEPLLSGLNSTQSWLQTVSGAWRRLSERSLTGGEEEELCSAAHLIRKEYF